MGITYVEAEAIGPTGKREAVRLLVDSGATYSLLPENIWRAIELEPTREMSFSLADGTQVVRQDIKSAGWCLSRVKNTHR